MQKISHDQLRKVPNSLLMGHTLKSISSQVLLKYADRPEKLEQFLPFLPNTALALDRLSKSKEYETEIKGLTRAATTFGEK